MCVSWFTRGLYLSGFWLVHFGLFKFEMALFNVVGTGFYMMFNAVDQFTLYSRIDEYARCNVFRYTHRDQWRLRLIDDFLFCFIQIGTNERTGTYEPKWHTGVHTHESSRPRWETYLIRMRICLWIFIKGFYGGISMYVWLCRNGFMKLWYSFGFVLD